MPHHLTVTTHNVTIDGRGVARTESGAVAFVARALRDETLRAEPVAQSRGVIHARTVEVLHASAQRTEPACPTYSQCDGCQWLHAHPDTEYMEMEHALREQVERLGRLRLPEPEPSVRMPRSHSRDRLSLQLDERGTLYWLGPAVPKGEARARYAPWHGRATGCGIAHPALDALGLQLQAQLKAHWSRTLQAEVTYARQQGHVPHVVLARGPASAAAALAWGNAPLAQLLDPAMADCASWVAQDRAGTVNDLPWFGATVSNDPRGFFQPSLAGAQALAAILRRWTDGRRYTTLYDVYGGQGLWAYALADRIRQAHVIDASGYRPAHSPERWRWQRSDLSRDALHARETWGGDAPTAEDLIVTDPPRAGLSPALIAQICASGATAMLYVSCGPDALGRDLQRLQQSGAWQVQRWCVVHQFPASGHAELVLELRR